MSGWFRLESRCAQWGWTGNLPAAQFAAWIKLLCTVKVVGGREGRIRLDYFCSRNLRAMRIPRKAWEGMLESAELGGAVRQVGGYIEIMSWKTYQPDPTDAERQKRFRSTQKGDVTVTDRYVTVSPVSNGDVDVDGDNDKTGQDKTKDKRISPDPAKPVRASILFDAASRSFLSITPTDLEEWADAYPATNPDLELKRMIQWLLANPTKAVKRNWRRFITNWLARTQDGGGTRGTQTEKGPENGKPPRRTYRASQKREA